MLSMTGYGRSRQNRDGRELLIELKAVNHRYLDVSYRLPKALAFLEDPLRALIQNGALRRGHIDVSITYQNTRPDANALTLDRQRLLALELETRAVAAELGKDTPTIAELIQISGALTVAQADEDVREVTELACSAYAQAYEGLQAMRAREGEALAADLQGNLERARALVERIAQRAPEVPRAYRDRLNARLAEWAPQGVDAQRVAQEVALLADRCAVDEELSRLRSHFDQFALCFSQEDEVGRRMDFLLQEMNREVNTIGSKATDAAIAQAVVDLKCLLEKLREQVQNIV